MTTFSLFEAICDGHNLQRAWLEVRDGRTCAARRQGAGIDDVTVTEWEVNWPERLRALQAELLSGAYRPSPLLWFDIPRQPPPPSLFPLNARRQQRRGDAFSYSQMERAGEGQDGGREARTRRLGIPTVTDRVAQRAVKNVLEPIWESVFLSCSHGFRPNRSVFTAIAHVLWHEACGLRWVADADIQACFESIEHAQLLAQLEATTDEPVVNLIAGWLETGAAWPGHGLAQGAVISPLLCNIFLHPFDVAMIAAGLALVRYADDFVVMCADQPAAAQALDQAAASLAELGLDLNSDKTSIVPFGPGFTFLGAQFSDV